MRIKELFLDALYPKHTACALCGREAVLDEHDICGECSKLLCPAGDFSVRGVSGAYAGLMYNDGAANIMHRFKYHSGQYLKESLASYIYLPDWPIDCIAPIPLHTRRERERGYNQSLLLACEVGRKYGVTVRKDLVKRVADTAAQANTRADKRRENIRGAFRASEKCRGLRIALVDDVITTGSTMEECAAVLIAAGAGEVYALAACYAGGGSR